MGLNSELKIKALPQEVEKDVMVGGSERVSPRR